MVVRSIFLFFIVLPFPVWAQDCVVMDLFVKPGLQVENTQSHVCGEVYSQCIHSIPINSQKFNPAWAYELSKNGDIINKWPMPVDARVKAVAGQHIIAAYPDYANKENRWDDPHYVKIDKQGLVNRIEVITPAKIETLECPEVAAENSIMNMSCGLFSDTASGKKRLFAFRPQCGSKYSSDRPIQTGVGQSF